MEKCRQHQEAKVNMLRMSFCSGLEDYCSCGEEFNDILEDEVDDAEDTVVHVFDPLDDGIWGHLTAFDDGN
jgi:hypothetical protein